MVADAVLRLFLSAKPGGGVSPLSSFLFLCVLLGGFGFFCLGGFGVEMCDPGCG